MKAPLRLSASTMIGDSVDNLQGESLGSLEDLVLETETGCIRYAVLSFGGFLGLGDKLFAVPWSALRLDAENKRFLLDVDKERLKEAPGFDKSDWPDMANPEFSRQIHEFYAARPYGSEEAA